MSIAEYIVRVRRAVCPRTAYATSGSAALASTLYALSGPSEAAQFAALVADLKQSLLQTKEFHEIWQQRQGAELVGLGNVTLVLVSASLRDQESEVLQQARRVVSLQQAPLVIALFELEGDGKDDEEVAPPALATTGGQVGDESTVVHHAEVLNGFRIVSTFVSTLLRSKFAKTGKDVLGSKGQPSVQSGGQFAYLWRVWQEKADDRVVTLDSGKERVLQRLADRVVVSENVLPLPGGGLPAFATTPSTSTAPEERAVERKYTMAEWDQVVRQCLKEGLDDFGIYNTVRLRALGTTLEQDLRVVLPSAKGAASAAAAPAATFGATKSAEPATGEDGRASFMVTMTLQCVPDRARRPVRTVLDYGCAEGAITAELGKQLGLTADKIFGADVRAIPAEGFTFVPLAAEDPSNPPALGQILPSLATGSVDLVTSAMVLHHVTHVPATLLELRRVVSPTGLLVLREHHCPSPEMAAFLDIMHGLYSLAWSQPVEWPNFLSEYRAWYRTREEWESLVEAAGFMRLPNPTTNIQGHYDAALRSKRKPDGRYNNLIRAYYAVYVPRHDFELPAIAPPPVAAGPVKRPRGDGVGDDSGQDKKRAALPVYESKKHKGQFYVLNDSGKPVWVKLQVRGSRAPAVHPANPDTLELVFPTDDSVPHPVGKIFYV